MLPKYRRVVEDLFEKKLLARRASARRRWRPASTCRRVGGAHVAGEGAVRQGEADRREHGASDLRPRRPAAVRRPRGFVFALAHEDDVRILRWKEKYDQIPENTKDPGLLKAKKDLLTQEADAEQREEVLDRGRFRAAEGRAAGKALQQGAAAVAAAGVPAEGLAGSRADPQRRAEAAARPAADRSGAEAACADAAGPARPGLCDSRPGSAAGVAAGVCAKAGRSQHGNSRGLSADSGDDDSEAGEPARLPGRASALWSVPHRIARYGGRGGADSAFRIRAGTAETTVEIRPRAERTTAGEIGDGEARSRIGEPRPDRGEAGAEPRIPRRKRRTFGKSGRRRWRRNSECSSTPRIPKCST